MASDIRIGVSADTSGVKSGMQDVSSAAGKASSSISNVGASAKNASSGLATTQAEMKRLERTAKTLQAEFGKAFDTKQAAAFLNTFKQMQNNKHLTGGSKIRQFDSFEKWLDNNHTLFMDSADADRYRRRVMKMAVEGSGGTIDPPAPPQGASGAGDSSRPPPSQRRTANAPQSAPSAAGGIATKGMATIKGVAGGALAIAGVMSVMSMAGRAVDMAKQEAVEQDKLLRGTGDLNREFDHLRAQVRKAGEGLGVTFLESSVLGRQYAAMVNANENDDIYGNLRSGIGLARGYGLDISEGVGFMGQMRQFGGVDDDDQNGRRLAIMIAEAIERSGSTAKASEILQAIAGYTSTLARATLTRPNVNAYAGALSGMLSTHTVGLDPQNAANILNTADAAVRNGGGMGEAGQNFTFGALSRFNKGLDPVMAKAIAEQGLFGSGAGLVDGPVGQYMRNNGRDISGLSGKSNFEILSGEINQQYSDPSLRLSAIQGYFGLNSTAHAAALANMKPQEMGQLENMLARAGVSVNEVSASGVQNLGAIGAASPERLNEFYDKIAGRSDITDAQRSQLAAARDSGDPEALREAMARVVSTIEQEANVGTETRDAVVDLNNALTKLGTNLLPIVSGIQSGVAALAGVMAPESDYAKMLDRQSRIGDYRKQREDMLANQAALVAKRDEAAKTQPQWMLDRINNGPNSLEELNRRERENFERQWPGFKELDEQMQSGGTPSTTGGPSTDAPLDLRGGYGSTPSSKRTAPKPDDGSEIKKIVFRQQFAGEIAYMAKALGISEDTAAAQLALETNWGRSIIPGSNNLGNVKATGWKGASVPAKDNMLGTTDRYRVYGSTMESAEDMVRLIKRNYPDAVGTGDDAEAFALGLKKGRGGRSYAEDPDYVNKIRRTAEAMPGVYLPTDGGQIPAGNPAGSPTKPQQFNVKVDAVGRLQDSRGEDVGELAFPSTTVSAPVPAGA